MKKTFVSSFVIADPREREQMIVDQIKEIEAKHGVRIEIDAGFA